MSTSLPDAKTVQIMSYNMDIQSHIVFISRHSPTAEQIKLAQNRGYALTHVGDVDAFAPEADLSDWIEAICQRIEADGYSNAFTLCAVHPRISAVAYRNGMDLAFFENSTRSAEGQKPTFYASALHVMEHAEESTRREFVRLALDIP